MFNGIDFNKLLQIFTFDKYNPLLFSTSLFLFLFFALLIFYRIFIHNRNARVALLLIFSFFFYYEISGVFFLILLVSSTMNYFFGILIGTSSIYSKRKFWFIAAVTANLLLLGYFKYTNFFIEIINNFKVGHLTAVDIFLPIGISFYTFKALSYIIDVFWDNLEYEKNFLYFSLFISFFANLLAGPIDRATEFLPQIKKEVKISKAQIGLALYLIISGLFKKVVIADYISLNFVDRVFQSPLRFTGLENLLGIYGYTLQIYADFSGYSDMAIGIALLLGFRLMDNFNSPYQAKSISEFWRRWHISLSTWLLDYLFKPLQMKFRNWRIYGNALALLITFSLIGLWHGASWMFILWGTVHGLYMVVSLFTKKYRRKFYNRLGIGNSKFLKVFQVFITFHLVAFAWLLFRASSLTDVGDMLSQIFTFFHGEVLMQFISGYKSVFFIMIIGYILHFIPKSIEIKTQNLLAKIPLIGQALLLTAVIWLVIQVKSAAIQPFIYFKF